MFVLLPIMRPWQRRPVQIDPIMIAGGVAGSYFDPIQCLFALGAAGLGFMRRPWWALALLGLYMVVKVETIGAVVPLAVVVDVAFLGFNYVVGWVVGRALRPRSATRGQ